MDRAAKLADYARRMLEFERDSPSSFEAKRMTTRTMLCEEAVELGYSYNEVSAAIDEALTQAGTTP
jgi:hypothetical protein